MNTHESPFASRSFALWLLHARSERLYPRLPRFVQRWVYERTVIA